MGMSCSKGQGDTLQRLQKLERQQEGWNESTAGTVFIDSPQAKDYGKTMNLPVFICRGGGYARRLGYVRINADGSYTIPWGARRALGAKG